MGTNRVALRSVEEFMADYRPNYIPMYSALLGNAQAYSEEVGKVSFNRLEAVGDIRAKHITPKDTVLHAIQARETLKNFKKYFMGSEFAQSTLQDNSRTEQVLAQVLDEMQKQFDEMVLFGEGTSHSNMINNGLFWSNDPNYTFIDNSEEIDGDAVDPLIDFLAKVMVDANRSKQVDGDKLLVFYGADIISLVNSVFAASSQPFRSVLAGVLGQGWSVAEMPTTVTPSGEQGWMIVTLPQVKLHMTTLPKLKDQGVDARASESWHHFLTGSTMVDVLALDAIIRRKIDGVDLGA